jgi:hypothetical protein
MVFRTIAENIRSFFQKEEQLEHAPKRAQDAAVELFEKPAADHRIVAHKLHGAPMPQEPQRPKLPFSAEQLKQRLAQQQAAQPQSMALPRTLRPQIADEDIASQIVEFEQAITTIPGEDGSSLPLSVPPKVAAKMAKSHPGYFDEFARFLREKGYDVDDATVEETVARMKQHHERRLVAEKHRERTESLEEQLSHKLAELQELEREWAARQEDILVARERTAQLEEEIARRTGELKGLVSTMRTHATKLAQLPAPPVMAPSASWEPQPLPFHDEEPARYPAAQFPDVPSPPPAFFSGPPPERRFYLHDGRSLGSLEELRAALLVMDDSLFYYHVAPGRNDFANWILGVFGDEVLAARALHVTNKYDLARLLTS